MPFALNLVLAAIYAPSVRCVYLYSIGRLYGMQPLRRIRRVYLYDRRMDKRAQAIKDAIEAITQLDDPQTRVKASTEALELINRANGTLAKLRREDIKALRQAGMSYREIGRVIGIHFTRVKQIESGVPTGNSARSRAAKGGIADE